MRLFNREDRDPAWAASIEEWLPGALTADLRRAVPGAQGVQVECRTTTCKIAWLGNHTDELKVRMVLRLLYRPLVTAQRETNECVVTLKEAGNARSDETGTVAGLKRTRAKGIADIRKGEVLDLFYGPATSGRRGRLDWIPPEDWPHE